jgi:hypothetical protein
MEQRMKYPLDASTLVETVSHIVEHNKANDVLVLKMSQLLLEAMANADDAESEWYSETEQLLKDIHSLKIYHETRRFNEENGHFEASKPSSPFQPQIAESDSEGEMTEAELSKLFKETRQAKKKSPTKTLKEMTLEEIESWESAQDNSNDIYKIKARIANLARGPGMSLTPQGEILCNSFVHMLKSLYDFAEKVQDPNVKIPLIGIIRNQESVPGTIIGAAGAGVTKDKNS